ncbi:MAG: hypothetical protein QOD06_754 [Candidatus Binatota bacterium]|nr:hypothetical protein [Candidatus Binatota bacterium]
MLAAAVAYEARTSTLQAWIFSRYAARLSYAVGSGRSERIVFPHAGPFDDRRGYSRLLAFEKRLAERGYRVREQARFSPTLARLVSWGIAPPYSEPPATGLMIRARDGSPLYDAIPEGKQFQRFEDVPSLLVSTLLLIENRELPTPPNARSNPAVEWDRLAKASLLYAGHKLGLPISVQGGSTLAVQLEKYRHSPQGRTHGVADKLRQMTSASLKAYRDGWDTRPWRREIVTDYLNTMPLAAAAGYGEVYGLGEGLYAWFGLRLSAVREALLRDQSDAAKVRAFKHCLALIAALPAPSTYLVDDRAALVARIDRYTRLLGQAAIIDADFAAAVLREPLFFLPKAPEPEQVSFILQKGPNAVRSSLSDLLGVPSFYDLNLLHLDTRSTLDPDLQSTATRLLEKLADPRFVDAHGLRGEHLLREGDPRRVWYSVNLFERTPEGNALRVGTDNLDRPLDINSGVKLELGSTAKLRTMAHYLEIVAALHRELSGMGAAELDARFQAARDPITYWAVETFAQHPGASLQRFLARALERKYSANPKEVFFTGGGEHTFRNFDERDDARVFTVREAFVRSNNLVFIRLMRDLVRYHQTRLPYDPRRVVNDPNDRERQRLLVDVAERETRRLLERSCRDYAGLAENEVLARLLGGREIGLHSLAITFFAWHRGSGAAELADWMRARVHREILPEQATLLASLYGKPTFTLQDHGFLLHRDPLEVWCAGELAAHPNMDPAELVARSGRAREASSAWLFRTRNRSAQNLRLVGRIEQDAFARMTPYWRRLGFPFRRLVPSLATAIGNSSDRPSALADLMGILVNGGVGRGSILVDRMRFAAGTPYETSFEVEPHSGERVMDAEVATALRGLLRGVVAEGTARKLAGAFSGAGGKPIAVGGKTGSGDNRFKRFGRSGGLLSARPVNRTATFVFYVGDRYFGVVTAYVPGEIAGRYRFTSALPVTVVKLLAPAISKKLAEPPPGTLLAERHEGQRPSPAAALAPAPHPAAAIVPASSSSPDSAPPTAPPDV